MYWRNSQFQIIYFILGTCHTADEAYRKARELLEEREMALGAQNPNAVFDDSASGRNALNCLEQCKRDIEFIKDAIARLEPHRKYGHLPDHEAFQLGQQEEWKLELKFRAENYLMSHGTIPADQLGAMRQHPEWMEIQNHILETKNLIEQKKLVPALRSPAKEILCLTNTPSSQTTKQ